MSERVTSKHGIAIRLTQERWAHITEEHGELVGLQREVLETVANPERILEGAAGEHMALRHLEAGKFMVVVYREMAEDGSVVTAFVTRRLRSLQRRKQLWP